MAIIRRYFLLPIEIDKGQNISSDRNGAVDILQEAIRLDKKINIFICSGTSCLFSGPTGYIHDLQEIFYTLQGNVFMPFKGVKTLKTINFPAPLIIRPDELRGQTLRDTAIKTNFEAVNAGRANTVWNTYDHTINNRSHTNQVAVEKFIPTKAEADYRSATSWEVHPSLYRSKNNLMMKPLLTLKLSPTEGTRPSAYRSRDGTHPSPRYTAEYCAAIWEDVLNPTLVPRSSETKVCAREMLEMRCQDPNILYSPGNYTADIYKDSLLMVSALLVCVNKAKHAEPQFFTTVEEMTKHWLTCLNLTLVAQPDVFKQRGRGNRLSQGGNTRALVGVDHSGNAIGPSTSKTIVYTSKDQSVMPDVDMEGNNFDNYDEID